MLSKILEFVSARGYKQEVKRLQVVVDRINAIEAELQHLSDEELRAKTVAFRGQIRAELAPYEAEVERVRGLLEGNEEVQSAKSPQPPFSKGVENQSSPSQSASGQDPQIPDTQYQSLSDEDKKALSVELAAKKETLKKKEREALDALLPEAFAVVKNACRRLVGQKVTVRGHEIVWNMIPFDVQLMGGVILHEGKISEMKTGEGKTLVATLPLYLNALVDKGVHLVTVNDYLAQRDCEWNGLLYNFLGLSVGVVLNGQGEEMKRAAYSADITYGTNNEFGFDYLRDNMAVSIEHEAQRGLHYAIVDEVDSILVDEARTPLIISAPAEESTDKYLTHSRYVGQLEKETHYVIDEKQKTATLTEAGIKRMEELMGVENIYTERGFSEVHHLEQALRARACYRNEVDYIVKDGEVMIVDEFTGRVLPGRRYSDGLHQAIEAKEGVEIKRESRTLATITFQNYFRLFDKLAGMTGTAMTEAEEFAKIYKLDVVPIPTNQNMIRRDLPDLVFKNEQGKFKALTQWVKEKNALGQPILVGTIAIEKSEALSRMFKMSGIVHNVLNAKYHEQEAEIITQAGQKGAVTIATNMAGRGTDIKLGEGISELGGLCIIGSERHESRRIDNQLRGRSGRQGDPGETQFYISLQDSLMRIFGGEKIQKMMEFLNIPEDMPIETKMISSSIESAQKRVEGHHFDMRKHVVEYDDVMNKQREIIYARRRKILHKSSVRQDIIEMMGNLAKGVAQRTMTMKEQADLLPAGQEESAGSEWRNELAALPLPAGTLDLSQVENFVSTFALEEYVFDLLQKVHQDKEAPLPSPDIMRAAERSVYLRSIDTLWMEHLDQMQSLRDAVGLHGYGQKDPLVEYKRAGFQSFTQLLADIERQTITTLLRIEFVPEQVGAGLKPAPTGMPTNISTNQDAIEGNLSEDFATGGRGGEPVVRGTIVKDAEVGRNDPCPCGSGKKYKKCHGINK